MKNVSTLAGMNMSENKEWRTARVAFPYESRFAIMSANHKPQTPRCKNGHRGIPYYKLATAFCQGIPLTHHKGFPYSATESNMCTCCIERCKVKKMRIEMTFFVQKSYVTTTILHFAILYTNSLLEWYAEPNGTWLVRPTSHGEAACSGRYDDL